MGLGKGQGVLSFLKLDVFSLVNMSVLSMCFVCVYVHHVRAWCRRRSEKSVGPPGTGVTDGGEPPRRCCRIF